jgi:hypothetical protein
MNQLQKNSLIFSIFLGILYGLLSIFPENFLPLLIIILISTAGYILYYFQMRLDRLSIAENGKFLIIPLLFNFGSVIFVNGLFQLYLRIIFTVVIVLSEYFLLVALKKVQNQQERAALHQRNLLISVTFFSLFLSLSALFKAYVLLTNTKYSLLPMVGLILLVGMIYYFLSYFLSWEYGINPKKFFIYNLTGAFLAMESTLFGTLWIINYPIFSSEERASLGGFPLPAIILTILFYFIWGVTSHKMDKSLNKRVLMEYIIITTVFLLVVFSTAKWLPIL